MAAASFAPLLEKLKSPHRSAQRHAVRSIFEALRSPAASSSSYPRPLVLHSPAGKQALSDCLILASRSPPALDEAILQLYDLAIGKNSALRSLDGDNDGDGEPTLALAHLQALLECSPSEFVPAIVRCIASVCRFLLAERESVLQGLLSYELHPLVKAFESRQESHLEIVQQVVIMLTQNNPTKDTKYLHFLEPVLNYLAVNSSLSNERYLVTRELCFNIASLVPSSFVAGRFLMRSLLCFNFFYLHQTQEADRIAMGLREIVDAVEGWVMQAHSKEEMDDCNEILGEILSILVDTCFTLNKSDVSPLPILQLLGHIVRLQKTLDASFMWRRKVLSLAYLLAVTDATAEQLNLICLARDVLRKTDDEALGVDLLIDNIDTFLFALLWIYPTVNIMTSSSSQIKETATNFLHDLEDILGLYWRQNGSKTDSQTQNCCSVCSYGQLADNMHSILLQIWLNNSSWETWISLKDTSDWINFKNKQSSSWLLSLSSFWKEMFYSGGSAQESKQKTGVISWICMLISAVLIHPVLNTVASEFIAEIVKCDRSKGLSFVPVLLFYLRAWKRNPRKQKAPDLFGLLKLLPSLAVDPMSSSIVVGTLHSLLSSECSSVLQATATRLLCRTWEVSDRVFSHLQAVLGLAFLSDDSTDVQIRLARAISLYDVCRKDGDSGVELILSVQACIESEHTSIKALGLQCLSWLCHHDVVDFYTAWDFLSDLFPDIPSDLVLAESILCFFQNGALDAGAYLDASQVILRFLWKATELQGVGNSVVRQSAWRTLSHYEVEHLNTSLGDKKGSYLKLLLSEKEPEALKASQNLIMKFLHHEYKFRRRDQEKRRHVDNKTEKIINAIPRVLFTEDDRQGLLLQSPAAYLLLNFDQSLGGSESQSKKKLQAWENEMEREFLEIADQINFQANLLYALLYLDLWLPFIKHHINRRRGLSTMPDTASKVEETSFHLMKIFCRISEQAIPRVAENAVLVLGILYQVSHTIPDSLIVPIVSYLKGKLLQQSHEYLQWTSAVSLGIIARSCSGAEWRLKMEISNCLLKCLSSSDRDLVRGACGIGLGFVGQNLMSQGDLFVPDNTVCLPGTVKEQELTIHHLIVTNVLNLFSVWFPTLFLRWGKIAVEYSGCGENLFIPELKNFSSEDSGCMWTVSGLCTALACTVISWERIGALNCVSHIIECMTDGIHTISRGDCEETSQSFAVGAFLSLPTCVETCLRHDISREKVDAVFQDIKQFMKVCSTNSNISNELKMSACIGSGNFIATVLHDGTFNLCLEDINLIIASTKETSEEQIDGLTTVGAFIGLSNILGSSAGRMSPLRQRKVDMLKLLSETMENATESTVCVPLLYSNNCKVVVQELLQYLLNVFLQEVKSPLKSCAGWALALIRRIITDSEDLEHDDIPATNHANSYKLTLASFPHDSALHILSSLLLDFRNNPVGIAYPYANVITILQCLREAPQLPFLDWGTVMRQMLQQMNSQDSVDKECANIAMQDDLCKECILFALAHAHKLSSLQIFLDEICEFSRLISVRNSISSVLMLHITDLSTIFSRQRFEKFFLDSVSFLLRRTDEDLCAIRDSRINFWKGLHGLLMGTDKDGSRIDASNLFAGLKKCLKLLDSPLQSNLASMEWAEALECISLASTEWISEAVQFDWKEMAVTKEDHVSAVKAVYILSQLVERRKLTPSTLLKPLRWLCQRDRSPDTFRQFLWVTSSLGRIPQKEKEDFLVEVIDITCSLADPEMGVLSIGLLASSWCSYAPLIILDSQKILELMPLILPLLLSEEHWKFSSKAIQRKLLVLLATFPSDWRKPGSGLYYLKGVCIAMSKEFPLADRLKLCMT